MIFFWIEVSKFVQISQILVLVLDNGNVTEKGVHDTIQKYYEGGYGINVTEVSFKLS